MSHLARCGARELLEHQSVCRLARLAEAPRPRGQGRLRSLRAELCSLIGTLGACWSGQNGLRSGRPFVALAAATLFGTGLGTSAARADLFDDAETLHARLSRHYSVRRLEPRVLERGESLPAAPGLSESKLGGAGCTTAIVLGSTNASFTLRMGTQKATPLGSSVFWETESVAGLISVTRCGSRRHELRDLSVEMRSSRAAVQRLLVESEVPLPPAFRYLPSREPGPPEPEPQAAVRVSAIPVRQRVALAEQSYAAAGAVEVDVLRFEPSESRAGEATLPFDPGCYRLRLFAPQLDPNHPLDAELRWPEGDGPASGDRLDTLDVELRACVVRQTSARLRIVGGAPGRPLTALRARFPLPRGLRAHWGAEGAAALSLAVHEQQPSSFEGVPVFDSLGSGGATMLHFEAIPGACYVAAVAPLREMSAPLVLAAQLGNEHRQNSSSAQGVGAALAFCAGATESVALEVESSPRESMWLLGVWQVGLDSIEGPSQ